MERLELFKNNNFGEVRVVKIDEKTYFIGNDIAKALGYTYPKDAVTRHCRGAILHRLPDNQGFIQDTKIIPEGDVYRLIANSQLPTAEKFEQWVFDEVLPSIRKHGMYATPDTVEKILSDPDAAIKILEAIKEERQKRIIAENTVTEQQKVIETQTPKALFADAVAASERSVLISELAKILKQNGVEIGQNRLFEWMRKNGYLCNKGDYYNQPTQRAMEMKLFELKKSSVIKPDGSILTTTTTKVTGRGQIYFINKFLTKKAA